MSHQRVSGFPEKGARLCGGPGKSRKTSSEVRETSGESLDCTHCDSNSTVRRVPQVPKKHINIKK